MKKAFIKINIPSDATKEEIDELKSLLDKEGLKYYIVRDIEK